MEAQAHPYMHNTILTGLQAVPSKNVEQQHVPAAYIGSNQVGNRKLRPTGERWVQGKGQDRAVYGQPAAIYPGIWFSSFLPGGLKQIVNSMFPPKVHLLMKLFELSSTPPMYGLSAS